MTIELNTILPREADARSSDDAALMLLRLVRELGLTVRRMRDETSMLGYVAGQLAQVFQVEEGMAYLRQGRQYSEAIRPANTGEASTFLPLLPGQVERLASQYGDDVHIVNGKMLFPDVPGHARTFILVPLEADGPPLGLLVLAHSSTCTLSPAEIEALRLIGQLLVGRLHEMRLFVQADTSARKLAECNDPGIQYTDALTGLLNVRGLLIELQQALQTALQNGGQLSVLLIQVDRYQTLHEYGSHYSDAMLKQVNQTLRGSLRGNDLLARFEDDKFCVLLSGAPGFSAVVVAERLRAQLATLITSSPLGAWQVTVSISVACLTPRITTCPLLLGKAQDGLAEANQLGGNQIIFDWDEALEMMAEMYGEA